MLYFDADITDNNRRTTVRYVREDITVILIEKKMFSTNRIMVKLLDIGSKGVSISCAEKLAVNKKVNLQIFFSDGRKFEVESIIVRKQNIPELQYGLKFQRYQNSLGNYLLSTQSNLVFS